MVVYFGACDVVWGTLQALYPPLYCAPANIRFAAPHWVLVVWILRGHIQPLQSSYRRRSDI